MSAQTVTSREEWLAARKAYQIKEDRAADVITQLNESRRELPMVEVRTDYIFETPAGPKTLLDLFDGRKQLIVYHFMFAPEWDGGCKYCSFNVDNVGDIAHLHARETSYVIVSRAPLAKLEAHRARMGWTFPWVSSGGSKFNQDFFATLDGTVDPVNYMYKDREELDASGEYYFQNGDQGGTTVFLREGERVFQTFATFGSKFEQLNGLMNYLDLTPLGRQELDVQLHDSY
jgi:predicted dithiol-disulfide oxidoreductase (DUF899 family)